MLEGGVRLNMKRVCQALFHERHKLKRVTLGSVFRFFQLFNVFGTKEWKSNLCHFCSTIIQTKRMGKIFDGAIHSKVNILCFEMLEVCTVIGLYTSPEINEIKLFLQKIHVDKIPTG